MKKIVLTALVLATPLTFSKPSLAKRTYHLGAGITSGVLTGLCLLGSVDYFLDCKKKVEDGELEKQNKPELVAAGVIGFFIGGTIGTCKLFSFMINSFKKAFSSSNLLEITRDNYSSEVVNAEKPFILAILPTTEEHKNTVCASLEALQEELNSGYTFGTIELHEAADILGIETPGIAFVKNGNLIDTKKGIYNKAQLRNLINKAL